MIQEAIEFSPSPEDRLIQLEDLLGDARWLQRALEPWPECVRLARAIHPITKEIKMSVIEEIAAERQRQREQEGWTEKHDDQHTDGSLAQAAACYVAHAARRLPLPWPTSWHSNWDKRAKHSSRRCLIIAAALIVAEIERRDRREQRKAELLARCDQLDGPLP